MINPPSARKMAAAEGGDRALTSLRSWWWGNLDWEGTIGLVAQFRCVQVLGGLCLLRVLARGWGACRSLTDDHAVAAGGALVVLGLRLGGGARVLVIAAGAAAIEADALAGAGDAVALTGARGAVRAGGAVTREIRVGAGRAGAVRERGAGRRYGRARAEVVDDVLGILVLIVDAGGSEALGQLILVELDVEDVAGGIGRHGLGGLDLGDGQGAALGDVARAAVAGALGGLVRLAGVAGRALGGRRR